MLIIDLQTVDCSLSYRYGASIPVINKGKKNNVGKMYLKTVKSNMHEAIDLEVIHGKNANSDLASYIFCEKGYVEIDYTLLRTAIADNGKKFVSNNNGKPYEIVICRNGNDLEL